MKILIRNAELEDSYAISRLSDQLGYKSIISEMTDRLRAILASKDHCVFVAVKNEKIVGWIHGFYSVRVESGFFTEIGGLVVDREYRGNGIGKMLMENVNSWSRLNKCYKIRVRSNVKRNKTHAFYTGLGYSELKEQKVFEMFLDERDE